MRQLIIILIILESGFGYCQSLQVEILDTLILYHNENSNDVQISICIRNFSKRSLILGNISHSLNAISENQEKSRCFNGLAFVLKDSLGHYYSYYFTPSLNPYPYNNNSRDLINSVDYLIKDTTIQVGREFCYKPNVVFPDLGLTVGRYEFYLLYWDKANVISLDANKSKYKIDIDKIGFIKSNSIRVKVY